MSHALTAVVLSFALLSTGACSSGSHRASPDPSVPRAADARPALDDYNLSSDGLAIKGYDPVAYFPEHGGEPTEGSRSITATHRGVTYRFANEANRRAFLDDPARYEPAYGGWCAWAMADGEGEKVSIDPESFTIENGRLFLFYDGFFADTRAMWKEAGGAPQLAPPSDGNWKRISGEAPPAARDRAGPG